MHSTFVALHIYVCTLYVQGVHYCSNMHFASWSLNHIFTVTSVDWEITFRPKSSTNKNFEDNKSCNANMYVHCMQCSAWRYVACSPPSSFRSTPTSSKRRSSLNAMLCAMNEGKPENCVRPARGAAAGETYAVGRILNNDAHYHPCAPYVCPLGSGQGSQQDEGDGAHSRAHSA